MALTRAAARTLCASNAKVGLRESDPRLDQQIDQAMNRLVRRRNAFVRREEFDAAAITHNPTSDPLQLDAPDALKLMTLALWREENNELQMAGELEARAYSLLEQDIVQAFEAANKTTYLAAVAGTPFSRNWYAARIGLDTVGGLTTSYTKLKRYVSRAADWIYQKTYEFQLIERHRVHLAAPTLAEQMGYDTTPFSPVIDYETMRLVVQGFLLEGAAAPESPAPLQSSSALLQEALALLERKLLARLEELRHTTYSTNFAALTSNTFGATVAQLGLELPLGLKYSLAELKRLANSAERRLVESGKWKNAIADFEVAITEDFEVNMPQEVEVVLGATICNAPTLIKGRWYEVVEGGPGRVSDDALCSPRGILVDRGEFNVSNQRVRRYFVGACSAENTLIVRAKRRFIPHSADADVMMIRNYSAIKAAATCLIHEGFCGPEQRDQGLAAFYWRQAIQILADEMSEHMGDASAPTMPVQTLGFGAGEIANIL